MLKLLRFVAVLPLTLFGGCATISPYTVDEATIEDFLQKQVNAFGRQQRENGLPLSLELERSKVTLGPDGRQVAIVDFEGTATLEAFITRIPIGLALKVEGAPVYDPEEKAVYIRDLKLLETMVRSGGNAIDLGPYTGTLSDVAARFLNEQPVYRLDESDARQRLFSRMNLGIEVRPGRLALVPGGKRVDQPE